MSQWGPYPERTEDEERERQEAEDRAGESRMEQRRETMGNLASLIAEGDKSRREDAAKYAALDGDRCQICGAQGADKRSLRIGYFYDMKEIAPEFLSLWYVESSEQLQRMFYLQTCKSCRAEILNAMRETINKRRALRGQELDHDGYAD